MAAEAGVDDVVLIAALALHRRMTEAELRHALGDRVYDAFAPNGLLTQHDAEDPDALVHLGATDQGEDVEINRRAAESDLLVYVNINLVAMDGGHKSVATGLVELPEPAPPPQPGDHAAQPVLHGPAPLGAALVELADGPGHRRQRGQDLPDRDHAQHRHVPEGVRVPPEAGVGVEGARTGWRSWPRRPPSTRPPPRLSRKIFHGDQVAPPDDLGAGGRGRGRPRGDDRERLAPAGGGGRGPDRHPDHRAPLHLPLQRQLDHEPDSGGVPRPRLPVQPLPGHGPWSARAACSS